MDDQSTLHSRTSLDPAQDFLDEHGSEIHPIFAEPTAMPQEPPLSVAPNVFSLSTQRQTEDFLASMDILNSSNGSSSSDTHVQRLDLRAKHSWDDMVRAAEDAQKAYEAAGHKLVRKSGRWISGHSEMAIPFTRLIPNDSYLSILYGGLRLVFEVLKSFLRIPDIIILAEESLKNFDSDKQLYELAESVFCAALPAIESTIRWLNQNPVRKQLTALVRGPTYSKSYKEKLQSLDEALNALQERASILRDQSIRKTEEGVDNVQKVLSRTDTQLFTMTEDLKSIAKVQDDTQAKVGNLHDLEQVREEARRAIRIVLEQNVLTSQWMQQRDRAIRRLKRHVEALQRAQVALTKDDLLEILNVPGAVSENFRQVQRACWSSELSVLESARSALESSKVTDWLQTDESSALFIEGESFGRFGRNTPLSILSTEIIEILRDKEPAVAIYHFCGLHTSRNDPIRGPSGIVRNLIWQVVRLYPPELDFISIRIREQLEALHLHTLIDCFCKLVRRLPNDTVLFCIIDGISFFETREWANDCREVMHEFQGLLEDDDLSPVFKLLVTSPARSRYVHKILPASCRIVLSVDGTTNTRNAPTAREVALSNMRPTNPNQRRRISSTSLRRKRYLRDPPAPSPAESASDWNSDSPREDDESALEIEMEMDLDTDRDVVASSLPAS